MGNGSGNLRPRTSDNFDDKCFCGAEMLDASARERRNIPWAYSASRIPWDPNDIGSTPAPTVGSRTHPYGPAPMTITSFFCADWPTCELTSVDDDRCFRHK